MKNGLLFSLILMLLICSCAKKNITDVSDGITDQNSITDKVNIPENITGEILKGNSIKDSGIDDPQNHAGNFNLSMSGYKGEMFIGISDGVFYGTIKFFNWGNGTPQPLKNLKVNEDRVYFIRSITSKEELEKYGGTAMFTQEFFGIFSKDRKIIRGYYRFAGTQDSWEAIRK